MKKILVSKKIKELEEQLRADAPQSLEIGANIYVKCVCEECGNAYEACYTKEILIGDEEFEDCELRLILEEIDEEYAYREYEAVAETHLDCCEKCSEWAMAEDYAHIYKEDQRWSSFELNSGLHVYGFQDVESLEEYLDDMESRLSKIETAKGMELCCSTSYLGAVGVKVVGNIQVASSSNLYSEVPYEEEGKFEVGLGCKRQFQLQRMKSIISSFEDRDYAFGEGHNEYIVRDPQIKEIWVKEWCPDFIIDHFEKLAAAKGYAFSIVAKYRDEVEDDFDFSSYDEDDYYDDED